MTLEGRNTAASSPFMTKVRLTESPDQPSNLSKMTPNSIVFAPCEGSRGTYSIGP
jgi:hypothetical protein